MATINDYYSIDQTHDLKVTSENSLTTTEGIGIPFKIFQDFSSGAIYLAFHLPTIENVFDCCLNLINEGNLLVALSAAPELSLQQPDNPTISIAASSLKFCGRIYFYSDSNLSNEQIAKLYQEGINRGLVVQFYGPQWAYNRSLTEHPLAFISHDSRDKESIARPLALELSKNGIPVWFDEFSLKVGDSLRTKIETGLKECKKCVLLITPRFLSNTGWTKREFDSLFTRELMEKKQVILPIWADVSVEAVYEYSPSLADKVALQWSEGVESIGAKLASQIRAN